MPVRSNVSASAGPLEGIRVLDLATMLAGPYAATLLGDLGADVIKVESHWGDDSRQLGPEVQGERSPFISINRNKRSLVLDLRKDDAQEIFARLLATTDVVITNVREPACSKLGQSYEQVKKHKPDIIWAGVTAFGPDGPYAGRPGIDFLAQGYGGLLSLNGEPAEKPVRVTVPLIDTMTSELVTVGVLSALFHRERTGEGQRIDVSLLDALTHAQCSGLGAFHMAGEITPRTGNRSQYFAPSGVYPTKDGKAVVITCPSDKFFRHLAAALDADWAEDERFRSIDARLANEDELDRVVGEGTKRFDRDELVVRLVEADVLTAPINELPEVAVDPQIHHNEMIVETDHAKLGKLKVTGVPVKLTGSPGSVRQAPPVLGEHTIELLTELGYAPPTITTLLTTKTIGTWDGVGPK
jgi:crotonobetainyl-CoA:carnitine CoA-transferase CaiB-like acyl-CoA transferase